MGLKQVSQGGVGGSADKQISVTVTGAATVYTVPTGRKFVGVSYGHSGSPEVRINGLRFTSGTVHTELPVLLGGTVVYGQYFSLFGVESDA